VKTLDGISSILVVGVDWFGDVLFATAALRALKKSYPKARVVFSTTSACASLLQNNPHVDRTLAYDEKSFLLGIGSNMAFLRAVQGEHFDAAVFLHRSATRAFLVHLAGIRLRAGYPTPKQRRYLTHPASRPSAGSHRAALYLGAMAPLGVRPDGYEPDFFPTPQDDVAARRILSDAGIVAGTRFAVVHPGGNWNLKRWPAEKFALLARRFEKEGTAVLICGTPKEKSTADAVVVASSGAAVSICGKTKIGELAALMRLASVVVSNDSGPLHLASAVGVPCVGVFGPTAPEETGPHSKGSVRVAFKKVGCVTPCYFEVCSNQLCMDALGFEDIWREVCGVRAA